MQPDKQARILSSQILFRDLWNIKTLRNTILCRDLFHIFLDNITGSLEKKNLMLPHRTAYDYLNRTTGQALG